MRTVAIGVLSFVFCNALLLYSRQPLHSCNSLVLATAIGGACYVQSTDQQTCYGENECSGGGTDYRDKRYLEQDGALCVNAGKEQQGKEGCVPNTPKPCTETYKCTGRDASGNCTGCEDEPTGVSTTIVTNCEVSGDLCVGT